ncbi:DUF6328 family protein [Gordonia sp. ABSL11-1]|jgi:hypothetical protein|uniref:DUF6328 family protein n=1 Tax=Gordonia sp. ABSL11-1 TaxID=3053924 RepID=UPI002573BE3F|nr:DUF6328 family protein [Gordonia sp. ABSL11-1]MDL9948842.1 DUF6328 family protein [Gordonia sp. ABSL11-1]
MTVADDGSAPEHDPQRDPGRDPERDPQRNETPTERLDRNWASLLQELRVVQTGGQILTGLMLTIPFQEGFEELTTREQRIFVLSLVFAVLSTITLISPVALHRLLFRRHAIDRLVDRAHRLTLIGITFLGLALTGVVSVIFDIAFGGWAALAAAIIAVAVFLVMWVALPMRERRHLADDPHGRP